MNDKCKQFGAISSDNNKSKDKELRVKIFL